MAGIIGNIAVTGQVWYHYLRLDRQDIDTARASMEALRDIGESAIPALRRGIRKSDEPRLQLRSAVVLHWLGQPDGLPVLVDALRYGIKARKEAANEVVVCFVQIGAPDANKALIDLWNQLPSLHDGDPTAALICSIWRLLQDPSMLAVMCESSVKTPQLFLDIIAPFGVEAVPHLRNLSRDPDPARRAMAARGLALVPGYQSAEAVVPLLRDESPIVRELAPASMESVSGPVATLNALVEANRAGYSTASSVQMLVLYNPPDLYELLAGLLTRYEPERGVGNEPADTVGAVCEASRAFSNCRWPHAQVTQLLCTLIGRGVHASIRAEVARTISERGPAKDDSDILAVKAMWVQLTVVDRSARAEAAKALERFGEQYGGSFESVLDTARPQGNLLRKLQATLLNSQDVGQAMSEAVQHVATWFSRVSRETADRFTPQGAPARSTSDAALLKDGRLPELLRKLLVNVLQCLSDDVTDEDTVEALSIGAAALRTLSRLDSTAARIAASVIQKAFETVKIVDSGSTPVRASGQEVAAVLREAAGQAIIDIYGQESYDILVGGLSNEHDAVCATAAGALGRLGDPRATPLLQRLTERGSPALARAAQEAITAIRRGNPEMMTLLRGSSSADAHQESLLRPTTGVHDSVSGELLLRPAQPGAPEQQQ